MRARRRSSLSPPNQTSRLVPYRTSDIEFDNNKIRPLDTGHSEPTRRTSITTFQSFSIRSPELPKDSSIATITSSELRADPFNQPTQQQRREFNFVQTYFCSPQANSTHSSFRSASPRYLLFSSLFTPRSNLSTIYNPPSPNNLNNPYNPHTQK